MKIYAREGFTKELMVRGYSIPDLAKAIGVSKQSLYYVTKNVNGVSPSTAKKIADVLGVEFDEIFVFVERKSKGTE